MGQGYSLKQGVKLRLVFPRDRIQKQILRVAEEINSAYADKDLLAVVVLKGALFFAADLLRALRVPVGLDLMELSSYHGTKSTGKVLIRRDLDTDVAGRDVLLIEDIVDTGRTLAFAAEMLRQRGAKHVEICTLIDKRDRREVDINPGYSAISWAGGFLVGYGLDLDGRMRELPDIYELVENPPGGLK